MLATFRLVQESVTGPTKTTEVESVQHAKELAVAWAEAQIGHPWDHCTVEIPDLDYFADLYE